MQFVRELRAGKFAPGSSDIAGSCEELAEALVTRALALSRRLTMLAEASRHMGQVNGRSKNWTGCLLQ